MTLKTSAADVRFNIHPYIDGRYLPSSATEVFDNVNPATEATLCQYSVGNSTDIDRAVRVARQRFDDGAWVKWLPAARAEVLLKLADLIVENKVELALLDTLEMGKPVTASLHEVGMLAPILLRSCAGLADKLLGVSIPLQSNTVSLNSYEPRGVVGAITPWNFPLPNAVLKIAPALAAGNCVVLKPSEISPSSALKLAELALDAGLPEGVLNVVPGLGSTVGSALALHPDVDLLSFTGSTITGRKLMELSGRSNGKPLMLECGGKSPQVVFKDVDLERVADAIVKNLLWNQGQVCSAHTRVVVHDDIKAGLLEKIIDRARQYSPGDPLDESTTFGPLASSTQRNRVKSYIDQGLEAGADAVLKGKIQAAGGCNVSPTIFDRVETGMSIVQEEIFGPVLCVQGFKTEQEAVALANGTPYALVATVWTRDMGRAKRLARAIRAGDVAVRTSGPEDPASSFLLSHEPQKASGFGVELGLTGLHSYSTLKSVRFSGA